MNKSNSTDLRLFGSLSAFKNPRLVGTPNIMDPSRLHEMIDDIFQRKWLTNNGHYVQELESQLQNFLGVKHVIAVNNGTTGLEIAIHALGLKGEAIVPSYTFIATPHSLLWSGITPVFCDIDPSTYNIDVDKIESLITDNTSAILAVDVYGRPSDKERIAEIAKNHNLSLIFDAAHSFGNSYKGKMIGNFGEAEVFSFHATKFFNSFEGGAIATNNDELAEKCRAIRNFGFNGGERTQFLGINGKMSEVSAAMGIVSLENIQHTIAANKQNYRAYRDGFQVIPGIKLIDYEESEKCNYQYVIIEVDETICGLSRDELSTILESEGIGTRKYFSPGCHEMEPYRTMFPDSGSKLPVTDAISKRVLALPTGIAVSTEDVSVIANIIDIAVKNSEKVREALRAARKGEK